jgi:hypothetical protein
MANQNSRPKRAIWKRVMPGDERKLRAAANDSDSGGGARDIRFSPWHEFEPIMKKMLPNTETRMTTRKSGRGEQEIRVGEMLWSGDGSHRAKGKRFELWPPTDSRPGEGRIAKSYELPSFQPQLLPPPEEGEVFFLIWEDEDGIWGQFLAVSAVRHLNVTLRSDIQGALDELHAADPGPAERMNLRGYCDFTTGEHETFITT